jgi:hypothetical protein
MSVHQSHIEFILCYILDIEFVEMRKTAVPAPDRKMSAANGYIVRIGHVAVSAFRGVSEGPDIIAPDDGECPWLSDVLDTRDIYPGRTAVVTFDFSFIRNCFYDLVCNLSAMIAVGTIPGKNKLVAHGKYWMR